MASKALLHEAHPSPTTDEDPSHGLKDNICRCTGYTPITAAVEAAARAVKPEDRPPR